MIKAAAALHRCMHAGYVEGGHGLALMLRHELSGLPRMKEVRLPGHGSPVITQPCTSSLTISMHAFHENGGPVMLIILQPRKRSASVCGLLRATGAVLFLGQIQCGLKEHPVLYRGNAA